MTTIDTKLPPHTLPLSPRTRERLEWLARNIFGSDDLMFQGLVAEHAIERLYNSIVTEL